MNNGIWNLKLKTFKIEIIAIQIRKMSQFVL